MFRRCCALFSFFFLPARHEANSVDNEHTNMLTSSYLPPPSPPFPNPSSPQSVIAVRLLCQQKAWWRRGGWGVGGYPSSDLHVSAIWEKYMKRY